MKSGAAKGAELASGLGAIVLGGGLALLAPDALRPYSLWLLLMGGAVHGAGMSLKYRIDSRAGPMLAWERVLFWLCWVCLALIAFGLTAVALWAR